MLRAAKHLIGLTTALTLNAFGAGASTTPVVAGNYVRSGYGCDDAPLAALLSYDGQNFLGAHDSNCVTKLLSADKRRYSLQSTCRAAGDGAAAGPYTEAQTVTVLSASNFIFSHQTGAGAVDRAEYRLCPETHP